MDKDAPIPGMDLDFKYSAKKPMMPSNVGEASKEMEATKKELEQFKDWILKNYKFTQSLSILPQQSIPMFVDEEEVPKETEKFIQIYMVVPEDQFKEIPKIKKEVVKELEKLKQKAWLQIKTPVDLWEACLDSKFELVDAVAMSFPLYDEGFLGALRMSSIHKSLVLQKFEKYVVSYVVGGSFLRGDATKTSDVDVFIIINDTDVKRMPRLELKERIRQFVYQYVADAAALAGVKNTLHIQSYLLTEFWESVKDAQPVIFTFIRDGIPLYDQGTFLPWKALLKMGKLKPSPESIDLFIKTAERTKEIVDRRLIDAMIDVYYEVLNPSQALLMLHGVPPPTHKETPKLIEEEFVEKEKMLKKSDIEIVYKVVKLFKDYEHGKINKISGKEVDELVKAGDDYLKKLKDLRVKIEKRAEEKTLLQMDKDITQLLENMFGKKSKQELIKSFDKLAKSGKFTDRHSKILREVIAIQDEFKKGKTDINKIDNVRKNAAVLIADLIEYNQRCDLAVLDKTRMHLKYKEKEKEKRAELLFANGVGFLLMDNKVKKLTDKVQDSNMEEVSKAIEAQKEKKAVDFNPHIFVLVKQELGNYEIIF